VDWKKKMKDLMIDKEGVKPKKKKRTPKHPQQKTLSKKKKRILTRLPEYLEICTG
jgi:hypothetical protein